MDRSTRITEFFNLLNKPNRPNAAEVRDAVKVRNELLPARLYRYRECTDYAFDNLKPAFRVGGRARGLASRWQTTLSVRRHVASTTEKLVSAFRWKTIDRLLIEFWRAGWSRQDRLGPRPKRLSLA
jgi:hypothetical protein